MLNFLIIYISCTDKLKFNDPVSATIIKKDFDKLSKEDLNEKLRLYIKNDEIFLNKILKELQFINSIKKQYHQLSFDIEKVNDYIRYAKKTTFLLKIEKKNDGFQFIIRSVETETVFLAYTRTKYELKWRPLSPIELNTIHNAINDASELNILKAIRSINFNIREKLK